jgi:hypothetical protein
LPVTKVIPGDRPIGLVADDLDADDHLDLAVACLGHPSGGQVPWVNSGWTVLLGDGDGGFSTTPLRTATYNPRDIVGCDVDVDGDTDLVVSSSGYLGSSLLQDAKIETVLNDGNGNFSSPVVTGLTNDHFDAKCGDVNGDGLPDLIVPYSGSSVVSFLPGLGDGAFGRPHHFETGLEPWALALGEFTGDDDPDVAVAHNETNDVVVLANECALPSTVTFGADKASMAWSAACAASSYNVYRGELSALVDGDGDDLPDGGYGQCINALDTTPDTVFDTFIVDGEIPAVASGFFYLVSFAGPSGEEGLGSTSDGLPREVAVPCPPPQVEPTRSAPARP